MSDQFTEVTSQGYGGRLGGSLMAALFGLLLVPVAIGLLYWNEGRAVDAMRGLSAGAAAIVEVEASRVDPGADGKLVHVTGTMQAAAEARDPVFGVVAPGLLRLSRHVEMYQWKQDSSTRSEQSIGGTKTTETTYSYARVWSSQPIDSARFKAPEGHRNPPMMLRSGVFDGGTVTLGAYRVDSPILAKLDTYSAVQPQSAPPGSYRLVGDAFLRGQDADAPAVGDVRVRFSGVAAQVVSVAAAQAGGTLTAFREPGGFTVALAEPGAVSAAVLFEDARRAAGHLTWILRGVGFGVLLVGLLCLSSPLTTLFAVLPFLESFVGAGAFLVALTLAVPVTLVTIAVAWIAHRPVLGGALLVGAAVALIGLKRLHPRRVAMAR